MLYISDRAPLDQHLCDLHTRARNHGNCILELVRSWMLQDPTNLHETGNRGYSAGRSGRGPAVCYSSTREIGLDVLHEQPPILNRPLKQDRLGCCNYLSKCLQE